MLNKSQTIGLTFLIIGLVLGLLYVIFVSASPVLQFFTSSTIPVIVKVAVAAGFLGVIILILSLALEKKGVEK